MADWHQYQLAIETQSFDPSTADALCTVHDRAHVLDVLDCDVHFGDGTEQIIKLLHLADRVSQWTYGRDMPDQFQFAEFEAQIRQFIEDFVAETATGQ